MVGILSFLAVVSGIIFVVALINLLIRLIKKKSKKLFVIMACSSAIVFFLLCIVISDIYVPVKKSEPVAAESDSHKQFATEDESLSESPEEIIAESKQIKHTDNSAEGTTQSSDAPSMLDKNTMQDTKTESKTNKKTIQNTESETDEKQKQSTNTETDEKPKQPTSTETDEKPEQSTNTETDEKPKQPTSTETDEKPKQNTKSKTGKKTKPKPKQEIRQTLTDLVGQNYTSTEVSDITINENLGTDKSGDYIALVTLTWNVQNNPDLTKKMLAMYSEDCAARVGSDIPRVSELCIFWIVPYYSDSDTIAKYTYERYKKNMYESDAMISQLLN